MLLHGIMSSITEFYSRNLGTETVKGLSQKAAQGGTVSKAPFGYRNVGIRDDMGREIRTVEVDDERATRHGGHHDGVEGCDPHRSNGTVARGHLN